MNYDFPPEYKKYLEKIKQKGITLSQVEQLILEESSRAKSPTTNQPTKAGVTIVK